MPDKQKDPQQELLPAESEADASTAQITALVDGLMGGLKPLAEQQAQVQLAQIEAGKEQSKLHFGFARTQLFTNAAILLVIIGLLAVAATFLLLNRREEEALRVIWFGMDALSGYGFGRVGRPRP